MRLTIELERATDMTEETWISHCLEIDCVSQGPSPRDAIVMVAEAIDMMVGDEIAALESSGQIENPGWERAFGDVADEVARRDVAPAPEPDVEQLRALVQAHAEENARLCEVCADQAGQIADLRAALSVSDRPRAVPPRHRWRTAPPTPGEVIECRWWWNKRADGASHVLRLDRDPSTGLILDSGGSTSGACPPRLDPPDWSGDWAPCMTPDDVTARVSRIAEAGRRLVMSHVGEVRALRAQLALEAAALELARAGDARARVTVAEARRSASVDSVRDAFESGFAIGLERGHDTALVRAEVTSGMVREDLAVRDRALEDHVAGLADGAGRR